VTRGRRSELTSSESDYRRASRVLVWLGPGLIAYNLTLAYLILRQPEIDWEEAPKAPYYLGLNLPAHAVYSLLNAWQLRRPTRRRSTYRLVAATSGVLLAWTCALGLWLKGSDDTVSVLLTVLTVAISRVYYDFAIGATVGAFALASHAGVVALEAVHEGADPVGRLLAISVVHGLTWLCASLLASRLEQASAPAPAAGLERGGPRPGSVIQGKYQLDRILGSGGMGTVFAARHLQTGKRAALKWLNQERLDAASLARFAQEAQAAGRIHHPNVVALYDVGEEDGRSFLVMELLEGQSLRERLSAGPLPVRAALDVVAQAARGVAAAHAAGVVHRDLKPENLFLTVGARQQRLVKVLDFGISKLAHHASELVTQSDVLIGTPLYMAPERLFGEASDERADIYALGIILHECLVGRVPFQAENAASLGRLHALEPALVLPSTQRSEVPELVDELVAHALARSPQARPRSAASFADALEQTLELLPDLHGTGESSVADEVATPAGSGEAPREPVAATPVRSTVEAQLSRIAALARRMRGR
jgi:tRNA A-37 threonylcarbamoyl transferase component Bud32